MAFRYGTWRRAARSAFDSALVFLVFSAGVFLILGWITGVIE